MAFDVHPETARLIRVDHASCELGGEAVLLDTDSGKYHGLNPVGTIIWRLLQQPHSIAELRDLIAAEFDVAPEQCEADVLHFVAVLHEHGLVRIRQASDV